MRNECPICKNFSMPLGKVGGYIEDTFFDIYECRYCNTQFILDDYDRRIYETIYSAQGEFGYERYSKYAKEIKVQENPLDWLSKKEPAYLYVEQYVRHKPKMKILEVGCGDGYLTYALNMAGHDCIGIDISMEAVNVAIKNFGNLYQAIDIKEFKSKKKYDLIILTETIEHLENPVSFVNACLSHLEPKGVILLTTPNKDYRSPNTIWQTEAPPVHRFWMGHKTFEAIAKRTKTKCEFPSLVMPLDMERNNIVAYWSSRGSNKFGSVLDKDGKVFPSRPSKLRNLVRDVAMWTPIRYVSNGIILYSPLPFGLLRIKEPPTLGVLLTKPS